MSDIFIQGELHRPLCPVHNAELQPRNGKFGPFYSCNWPDCDITASKSPQDGRWRTSTQAIRNSRHAAHAVFDAIWKSDRMSRREAYAWLGKTFGLTAEQCHIQHLNIEGCKAVIRLCGAPSDASAGLTAGLGAA